VTKQEVNVVAGRTYFFVTKQSDRSKALTVGSFAGLTGMAVTAIATSGSSNPPLSISSRWMKPPGRGRFPSCGSQSNVCPDGAGRSRIVLPKVYAADFARPFRDAHGHAISEGPGGADIHERHQGKA
jgi:hypothetical protein